ncbi:Orf y [Tanacetum coccineum]
MLEESSRAKHLVLAQELYPGNQVYYTFVTEIWKKYGMRKSRTYKGKPHNSHVKPFKRKYKDDRGRVKKCKCFICGKEGHFAKDCRSKQGNIARSAVYQELDLDDNWDIVSADFDDSSKTVNVKRKQPQKQEEEKNFNSNSNEVNLLKELLKEKTEQVQQMIRDQAKEYYEEKAAMQKKEEIWQLKESSLVRDISDALKIIDQLRIEKEGLEELIIEKKRLEEQKDEEIRNSKPVQKKEEEKRKIAEIAELEVSEEEFLEINESIYFNQEGSRAFQEQFKPVIDRLKQQGYIGEEPLKHWKKNDSSPSTVQFLGGSYWRRTIKLQPHIIKKIVNFNEEELKTKKGLRSFLGILNYARNHIPKLGILLRPLYEKTNAHGDKRLKPSDYELVRKIKEQVQNLPDLEIPPENAYIILETDGCMEGWGGIVKWKKSKEDPRSSERICAYASGKFSTTQSTIDAEINACINTLEKLKIYYLDKQEVTLRTDCQAIIRCTGEMKELTAAALYSVEEALKSPNTSQKNMKITCEEVMKISNHFLESSQKLSSQLKNQEQCTNLTSSRPTKPQSEWINLMHGDQSLKTLKFQQQKKQSKLCDNYKQSYNTKLKSVLGNQPKTTIGLTKEKMFAFRTKKPEESSSNWKPWHKDWDAITSNYSNDDDNKNHYNRKGFLEDDERSDDSIFIVDPGWDDYSLQAIKSNRPVPLCPEARRARM